MPKTVVYLNPARHPVALAIHQDQLVQELYCVESAWTILYNKFKDQLRFTKFFETQRELKAYCSEKLKVVV